jgi:hypothetical protein
MMVKVFVSNKVQPLIQKKKEKRGGRQDKAKDLYIYMYVYVYVVSLVRKGRNKYELKWWKIASNQTRKRKRPGRGEEAVEKGI